MKLIAACFGSLLIGVGLGWYFGYGDSLKFNAKYRAAVRETSEYGATIAFAAIVHLGRGDTNEVLKYSAEAISSYYKLHRLDGNPELLRRIESHAKTNAVLAAAISRKSE